MHFHGPRTRQIGGPGPPRCGQMQGGGVQCAGLRVPRGAVQAGGAVVQSAAVQAVAQCSRQVQAEANPGVAFQVVNRFLASRAQGRGHSKERGGTSSSCDAEASCNAKRGAAAAARKMHSGEAGAEGPEGQECNVYPVP